MGFAQGCFSAVRSLVARQPVTNLEKNMKRGSSSLSSSSSPSLLLPPSSSSLFLLENGGGAYGGIHEFWGGRGA